MGPFHWLLDSLSVPDWITQRLWWSLVLCVAFLGVWKLCDASQYGVPWTRFAVALFYALSPADARRTVDHLGRGVADRDGSVGTAAAGDPAAPAPVGGESAGRRWPSPWSAESTRSRPARRWSCPRSGCSRGDWTARQLKVAVGWFGCVVAVSAWWLVPLVLLGRYSPPFLDWIEDAAVTTRHGECVRVLPRYVAVAQLPVRRRRTELAGGLALRHPADADPDHRSDRSAGPCGLGDGFAQEPRLPAALARGRPGAGDPGPRGCGRLAAGAAVAGPARRTARSIAQHAQVRAGRASAAHSGGSACPEPSSPSGPWREGSTAALSRSWSPAWPSRSRHRPSSVNCPDTSRTTPSPPTGGRPLPGSTTSPHRAACWSSRPPPSRTSPGVRRRTSRSRLC